MKEKIFIIEDEEKIRRELGTFLSRYGYDVVTSDNFENIVDEALEAEPNVVLLDINLPYYDGYYICREIRKISNVPIIVVTSRDSDMDELMSMNLGADDFVTKPYNTQILLARINSVLKRVSQGNEGNQEILIYNNIKLNLSNGTISYGDNALEITKNELRVLYYLIKNQGNIVSREDLMDYLWKSNLFVDDNTLSVNVTRLRKKLEEIGVEDAIETRRGLGYIMP